MFHDHPMPNAELPRLERMPFPPEPGEGPHPSWPPPGTGLSTPHPLLDTLARKNYDLIAFLESGVSMDQLTHLADNPNAIAQLEKILYLAHLTLAIRAIEARHVAINGLIDLAQREDQEPRQRRLNHAFLIRTTSQRILGGITMPPIDLSSLHPIAPPSKPSPPAPPTSKSPPRSDAPPNRARPPRAAVPESPSDYQRCARSACATPTTSLPPPAAAGAQPATSAPTSAPSLETGFQGQHPTPGATKANAPRTPARSPHDVTRACGGVPSHVLTPMSRPPLNAPSQGAAPFVPITTSIGNRGGTRAPSIQPGTPHIDSS